jgi:hypothetical protein
VLVEEYDRKRENLRGRSKGTVRLDKDAAKIEQEMQVLTDAYDREAQLREESLRRFATRYPNVTVVSAGMLTEPANLRDRLKLSVREAGAAITPKEQQDYAEKSIEWLAKLARGSPKGYDVKPVASVLLNTLRTGKLSEKGQLAAIAAVGQLAGARPQSELAAVVLDGARLAKVREEATRELIRHVQKYSPALPGLQVASLRALATQPTTPAPLKTQLASLLGSLRPSERATGERLRGFDFAPPALPIVPPPPP